MSGLRLLHISDFAAPYPGAFIRQLEMLDDTLRERRASPLALAFPERARGHAWLDRLRDRGISIRLLPEPVSRAERRLANAVSELLDEFRPHVVHTHFGTYDLSVTRAVRQARSAGAHHPALVWHYRTALEVPVERRRLLRRAKDYLKFARAGAHVDACIAVTAALAEEAAQRGMKDRARAVVAGCDTDTFRPDAPARERVRAELGISDEQILVLHMGWAWWRKGGDVLAAAARELAATHPQLVFASIGAPAKDVAGTTVRRLEPTDAVHELHQAADIFVSASRSEGFGNGLVEALACERVAVAAFVDGQREVFRGLEDCCIPVPVADPAALAAAVRTLVARRDSWPQLGAHARRHIVERHSMRTWAQQMADVYAELVPHAFDSAGGQAIDHRLSA